MHLHDLGRGSVTLLLHGSPSPSTALLPLAEKLARSRRVLVPDLPGYGGTAPIPGGMDAADAAIEQMLRSLNVDTMSIVGFSLGTYRALRLALRGGVRVERLVLLGAFAHMPADDRAQMAQLAMALRSNPALDLGPILVARMLSPDFARNHPAETDAVRGWALAAPPETLIADAEALAELEDLRPRLGVVDVPVLIRTGLLDVVTPIASCEELAMALPRAALERVSGVGHALFIEDFEGTAASVDRFLGGR